MEIEKGSSLRKEVSQRKRAQGKNKQTWSKHGIC
jgi:hypothetical protein